MSATIVGYYTSWSTYHGYPPSMISGDNLNYINYAFAKVNQDGTVTDDDSTAARKNFPQLIELKKKHPGLKTLISIGGHGNSQYFATIASTEHGRKAFARSAAEYMRDPAHQFDGIDVDWEFPTASDTSNFTSLMQELRKEIGSGKLLTIAAGHNPNTHLSAINFKAVMPSLDWVTLVAYNYNGSWSSLTDYNAPLNKAPSSPPGLSPLCASGSVQYLTQVGVNNSKIYIGIPFYGRVFSDVAAGSNSEIAGLHQPFSKFGVSTVDYKAILADYASNPKYKYSYNSTRVSASLYSSTDQKFVVYDDIATVNAKCAYIQREGLAGATIWDLGKDEDGKLLDAVHSSLH